MAGALRIPPVAYLAGAPVLPIERPLLNFGVYFPNRIFITAQRFVKSLFGTSAVFRGQETSTSSGGFVRHMLRMF